MAAAEDREAAHGQRMIELKVRFWTDSLSSGKGRVRARHGWTSGLVRISGNVAHGIVPAKPVMFNSMAEIPRAIERALISNEITLHPDRERRYIAPSDSD